MTKEELRKQIINVLDFYKEMGLLEMFCDPELNTDPESLLVSQLKTDLGLRIKEDNMNNYSSLIRTTALEYLEINNLPIKK